MLRATRSIRVVALAVVAAGAGVSGESRPSPGYRELIAAYRNQSDTAVRAVLELSTFDVRILPYQFITSDWTIGDLQAAAMLHLDAYLELAKGQRDDEASVHLATAEQFLGAALTREPGLKGFSRRWYAAAWVIADGYAPRGQSDELRKHADRHFPRSRASEAYEEGLQLELRGVMGGPLSRSDPRLRGTRDPEATRLFKAASDTFGKASLLDAALLDAALHMGRVLILAGEPAKAVQPLIAAAQSPDRHVRYLAMMFLGAIAEADGRLDEAEARYRASAATAPFAQSAPFALAHVFERTGRDADARAILSGHFARTRGRVAEPLWTYLGAPADHLAENLQELRSEVWR